MRNNYIRELYYCFIHGQFQTSPHAPHYAPARLARHRRDAPSAATQPDGIIDLSGTSLEEAEEGGGGYFCELIFRMY